MKTSCSTIRNCAAFPRRLGGTPARIVTRTTGIAILTRLLALFLCGAAISSSATTRTVISLSDDGGAGTLRTLISASAAGDTINFGINGTITLAQGELAIGRNLSITGPGTTNLTISGNNASRVFNILSSTTVSISGLTIANGLVSGVVGTDGHILCPGPSYVPPTPGQSGAGGGVLNNGNLTLSNCVLTSNNAIGGHGGNGNRAYTGVSCDVTFVWDGASGGIGSGGAIYNGGNLFLVDCTVRNNSATGGAGGDTNDGDLSTQNPHVGGAGGDGSGGAICSAGAVTTVRCALFANYVSGGSGGKGSNGDAHGSVVEPGGRGGHGGAGLGAALFTGGSMLAMTNCTMFFNRAFGGQGGLGGAVVSDIGHGGAGGDGGNADGGAIQNSAACTLVNCTISGNMLAAGTGGAGGAGSFGFQNGGNGASGSALGGGLHTSTAGGGLWNTIIAANYATADVYGAITSNGHNLIGITDGSSGWLGSDLTGTIATPLIPLLGPLQDNGGPTFTMALNALSAALDNGDDAVINPPISLGTDQRGLARLSGSHVDIGAFELQQCAGFTLTTGVIGSGSVSKNPDQTCFPSGNAILTALAAPSWIFDHWSGDASGTANPLTVVMTANKSITATFQPFVSNTNDSGAGSLRQAIANAPLFPAPVIIFAPNVTGSILLMSELDIANDLTISGPGAKVLTVDGNGTNAVFSIGTATVSISGLTIANGAGGIFTGVGTTALVDACTLSGHHEPAVYNSAGGTIVMNGCTISGNHGTNIYGAGVYNVGATLRMTNCTVSGNSILNTTPLALGGGGIYINSGTATLISCTICSNNVGGSGTTQGGGIYNGDTLTVANSIIADNSSSASPDVFGAVTSIGYNLVTRTNGSSGWVASDITGSTATPTNALLGPLQNNGGTTLTHALLPGSPAIDAGTGGGLTTDQRGQLRPYDNPSIPNAVGGDGSDIGAYELQQCAGFTLTTGVIGAGSVTKNPDQTCFPSGNALLLTALAASGWVFDHWSGDASGTDNPLSVTMTKNKTVTANFTPLCTPSPSGLISWWPGAGNANDIIGTNKGTLMNGATFAAGEVGTAFSLDGLDDFVAVPDSPSLNPSGNFSIEAWIKTSGTPNYSGIVNKYEGFANFPGTLKSGYFLGFRTGGILWCGLVDGSGNITWASNSKVVTDGQWHHAVAILRPNQFENNDWAALYVDGAPSDGLSDPAGYSPSSHPLYIGNGNTDYYSGGFFNGSIDEVSIYNRALSASEVQALYLAGSSGKCLGPIQIINVNESGQTVNLTWLAQKGIGYRVQYKTNLNSTTWSDLTPDVVATNTTASQVDSTLGNAAQRFYRVQLLQ